MGRLSLGEGTGGRARREVNYSLLDRAGLANDFL
jgi:hypothetical protein